MYEVGGLLCGDWLGWDDSEVYLVIWFVVVVVVVGVGFFIMGVLLVSMCSGVDIVVCGLFQWILLVLGGLLILCVVGLWVFLCIYWVWCVEGIWWGWYGVGWFLLMLMVLMFCIGVLLIVGLVMVL